MKIRTNEFKEEIVKFGREIDFKINLHINDRIITQDNKFLITQDNLKLIVEQFNEDDIDETIGANDIYNAVLVNKGNLLSTIMKEFDFEISEELRLGDVVDCSFGLKVEEEYEYINYGKYIVYSKEKNEDTNTFSYVAFDSMLFSMVGVDDTSIIQNVTVQQAIENICEKVGLSVNITSEDLEALPNLTKVINEKAFTDIEMTYRDVLDMICQCLGVTMVSDNKTLYLKTLNENIVDSFDEKYLKDVNVKFGEKYGPVNSIVLSRSEDNDTIYKQDEDSINTNGLHEFKIKDNLIMLYDDREDYIDEIFEQLNGLEFYVNDFTSTGITYLEPLDFYNIIVGENTYKCLSLNDEIKIQQGLEESIYTEMPEETTTDYKISAKTDKEVSFIVDKQNGQIKARVTQGEMESYVEQTAEEITTEVNKKVDTDTFNSAIQQTSEAINLKVSKNQIISEINQTSEQITINANKISLAGKTIQMTSDNIAINSNNLQISNNGNIILKSTKTSPRFKIITNNSTGNELYCYYASNGIFYRDNNTNNNYNLSMEFETTGANVSGIDMPLIDMRVDTKIGNHKYWLTQSPYSIAIAEYNNYGSILASTVITASGITTPNITQTSKEEDKKNFEKYNNALEQIKNTDIYKYNLKNENDDKKKHIGFVIGKNFKYSKDIVAIDKDNNEIGVDTYSMVSVLWQAVKEQQEQIEKLQQEIKSLKGDEI